MLACPKCGHDNELGRIFCHKCGTKLDLSQIKPPGQGGKRLGGKKSGGGGAVKWVIRLVILGGLAWGVYLMAQVPDMRKIDYSSADIRAFYQQLDALKVAEARKSPVSVQVNDSEIAAYMATFKTQEAEGRGIKVIPGKLQMELGEGVVTTIVVGRITVGSVEKGLYISYTGVPEITDGHFQLRPVAAAIGALPIHPWILEHAGLIQSYFKQIYGGLQEKELLENLTKITVRSGVATLEYQPEK